MKVARYPLRSGGILTIEYDENVPCRICGEPVIAASMGGADVCPWCDMGVNRKGVQMHYPMPQRIRQPRTIHLPGKCPACSSAHINLNLQLDGRLIISCLTCQLVCEKSSAELILESRLDDAINE